jgi:hypothetical protein
MTIKLMDPEKVRIHLEYRRLQHVKGLISDKEYYDGSFKYLFDDPIRRQVAEEVAKEMLKKVKQKYGKRQ